MIIRPETSADYEAIAKVVEAAFGRENEARLVGLLREPPSYVPALALVAEEAGRIVGHVMISYATLRREHDEVRVLSLAPLAVLPECQKEGIGAALMREGIARADALGEPLIVLLGHPAYYPQFGFERARQHGIEPPSAHIPDAAFMMLRLANYDRSLRGDIVYSPAFEVVAETA